MTPEEIRAALDEALAELQTAHEAILGASDDADLTELEQAFSVSEARVQRLQRDLDRTSTLSAAQAARTAATPATPPADSPAQLAAPAAGGPIPRIVADTTSSDASVPSEEPVYHRHSEFSFFQDAMRARFDGDTAAQERLRRNNQQVFDARRRDGTFANPVGSSGAGQAADFVPPLYLQQDWIGIARAARPFADAVGHMPLPDNTNVIIFPKLAVGTSVGTQADNAPVVNSSVSTGNVQVPVITIAGQQDMSRQLLERSTPGFDVVINQDLTKAYHAAVDQQMLAGPGTAGAMEGILTNPNVLAIAYTDATPAASRLFPKIGNAIQQVHTNRFLPPSLIVMHPSRWQWLLVAVDTNGRPLVTPVAQGPMNALAQFGDQIPEGIVGSMLGLPVMVDAQIPTNLGAGANQDAIIVTRADDQWLMENPDRYPLLKVFEETLSGTMTIRLQLYGYVAFTSERFPKATAIVQGTGLVSATF